MHYQSLDSDQDSEGTVKRKYASLFAGIMFADKNKVTEEVGKLISRLTLEGQHRLLTDKEKLALALRLEEQYPGDIGVIVSFLLNYVKLIPDEAISIGAKELHAYISGECIECMATSDNVVRAGLTPKHRDVETLYAMLTYKHAPLEIMGGTVVNQHVTKYRPPFDEFEIDHCVLPEGTTDPPNSPRSLHFLVVKGGAILEVGRSRRRHFVAEGHVFFFAAANTEVKIRAASELVLYRAGVNSKFFQASQV